MFHREADSSLSHPEREDGEVDKRLRPPDRPQSRKYVEERAPRQDLRERKIKEDDPDLDESDRDMSLNRKVQGSLRASALRIMDMELGTDFGFAGAAASYETSRTSMFARVSQYHGVLDQKGNPVQPPNTGYVSFHSRNFTEDNYKSILAYAEALLEQPWLKYGWDGGTRDAQFRAALDLSIHVADGCLYQSKIDVDTYNLLYNRLAEAGHDSFSETVIPVQGKVGQKRSAGKMRNRPEYMNIVRVASGLRITDPVTALSIIKNLRSLVSSDAGPADPMAYHVALEDTAAKPGISTRDFGAPPGETAAGEDDSPWSDEPGETAAGESIAQGPGEEIEFQSMSDEDFEKVKKDLKRDVDKLFTEDDVAEFMKNFDNIISDFEKKTASSLGGDVLLSALLRIAASSDAAKRVLGPIIVAAKKKKDKKKGKKKGKKPPAKAAPSTGGKAPPFGGKGAPPFGGKGQKRKADLTMDDISW